MLAAFISILAIFLLIVINEIYWREKKTSDEISRKIVHISVGAFVAFWPYYLSYKQIQVLGILFFLVNFLTMKYHLLKSIHHIKRKSYGVLFFAISVVILAIIMPPYWVFTVAMLITAIADGLAAIIGEKYGKNNTYRIFGITKSVVGTLSFIIISYLILLAVKLFNPQHIEALTLPIFIFLPLIAAFAENIGIYGSDDLLIPMIIVYLLRV